MGFYATASSLPTKKVYTVFRFSLLWCEVFDFMRVFLSDPCDQYLRKKNSFFRDEIALFLIQQSFFRYDERDTFKYFGYPMDIL